MGVGTPQPPRGQQNGDKDKDTTSTLGAPGAWGGHMGTGTGTPRPPRTLHQEVDNAAGDAKAVGGHTVVGALVACVGAGDGDDGAVGADLHVVWARRRCQHRSHRGDHAGATPGTTVPWRCWPGPIRQVTLMGRAPSWMRHLKVASSPGATAMLCGSMEMMGLCRPVGSRGQGSHRGHPCPSPPRHPPSPRGHTHGSWSCHGR